MWVSKNGRCLKLHNKITTNGPPWVADICVSFAQLSPSMRTQENMPPIVQGEQLLEGGGFGEVSVRERGDKCANKWMHGSYHQCVPMDVCVMIVPSRKQTVGWEPKNVVTKGCAWRVSRRSFGAPGRGNPAATRRHMAPQNHAIGIPGGRMEIISTACFPWVITVWRGRVLTILQNYVRYDECRETMQFCWVPTDCEVLHAETLVRCSEICLILWKISCLESGIRNEHEHEHEHKTKKIIFFEHALKNMPKKSCQSRDLRRTGRNMQNKVRFQRKIKLRKTTKQY